MKSLHIVSIASVIALSGLSAAAQDRAASAPMPAMTGSAKADCGTTPNASHDHTSDRGASPRSAMKARPCPPTAAASSSATATKKKQRHDHAKFKNL